MYLCLDPFPIYRAGSDRAFNPWMNGIDGKSVACGRCENCVKNRKQAWTGKLVSEALTSKSVTFLTLTYRNDPEGEFDYTHIQGMLYRLRTYLARKAGGTKVRFFCVGENGEKYGRVHWHLLLFFDREFWFPVPEKGELSPFWDHGWTQVENLRDPDSVIRSAFYCSKYAVKGLDGKGQRPRCSLKPALGQEWLLRHAHDTAKAGLCPTGKYVIPGVKWTRGKRMGEAQTFAIRGSQIRHYIKRYRDSWAAWWPNIEMPQGPWLRHYDKDGIDPVFAEKKSKSRLRVNGPGNVRPGRISLRPTRVFDPGESFWSDKIICGPEWSATLRVCYSGPDRFRAVLDDGQSYYEIETSIGEVLVLLAEEIQRIDKWIALQRGPEWSVERVNAEIQKKADEQERARLARESRREGLAQFFAERRAAAARRIGQGRTPGIALSGNVSGAAVAALAYPRGTASR